MPIRWIDCYGKWRLAHWYLWMKCEWAIRYHHVSGMMLMTWYHRVDRTVICGKPVYHPAPVIRITSLSSCPSHQDSAVQGQKAVTAYFSSKQSLPSGFAEQYCRWTRPVDRMWVIIITCSAPPGWLSPTSRWTPVCPRDVSRSEWRVSTHLSKTPYYHSFPLSMLKWTNGPFYRDLSPNNQPIFCGCLWGVCVGV